MRVFTSKMYYTLFVLIMILTVSVSTPNVLAEVSLPQLFSDNMILQRDKPVRIWGWADEGEKVTITLNGETYKSTADKDGKWEVKLKSMLAGGPFNLTVHATNKIELKNILIGEVWISSGQSNMEWTVLNSNNSDQEIASADYPEIRLFTVKRALSSLPKKDLSEREWQICNPRTVGEFSAVGLFLWKGIV